MLLSQSTSSIFSKKKITTFFPNYLLHSSTIITIKKVTFIIITKRHPRITLWCVCNGREKKVRWMISSLIIKWLCKCFETNWLSGEWCEREEVQGPFITSHHHTTATLSSYPTPHAIINLITETYCACASHNILVLIFSIFNAKSI